MGVSDAPTNDGKKPDKDTKDAKDANASEAEKASGRLLEDAHGAQGAQRENREKKSPPQAPLPGMEHLPSVTLTDDKAGQPLLEPAIKDTVSTAAAGKTEPPDGQKQGAARVQADRQEPPRREIDPGERFQFQGQLFKYLGTDESCAMAVLERREKGEGEPRVITTSRENIAKNYTAVPILDRYLYVDKEGTVFEDAGKSSNTTDHNLREVKTLVGIPPARLGVKIRKPNWEEEDAFEDALKKRLGDWQDTKAAEYIDGQLVKVAADRSGARRKYSVNGQEYELSGKGLWYKHLDLPGPEGPVKTHGELKLHITTTGAADLKRVQAVIIPDLEEAVKPGGPLHGKLHGYKTHDPMFGFDANWGDKEPYNRKLPLGSRTEPGARGQEAKGFTIYPASDIAAKEVSEFCSKVLKEKGLALRTPHQTGNVGDRFVDKESHRVCLEKDYWAGCAYGQDGRYGAAIVEEPIEKALRQYAEKKAKEGAPGWEQFDAANGTKRIYEGDPRDGRLSKDALTQMIMDARIDRGSCGLVYSSDEAGARRLAFFSGEEYLHKNGCYYLDEARAQKEPVYEDGRLVKGLTGRPAYYALAQVVGDCVQQDLNPARLQLEAAQQQQQGSKGNTVEKLILDKALLQEELIRKLHDRAQELTPDMVASPSEAGARLRNSLIALLQDQGAKDSRLSTERLDLAFDANAREIKTEHFAIGETRALTRKGADFFTTDGQKISPHKVTTKLTLPESLLAGRPSELSRELYCACLEQACIGQTTAPSKAAISDYASATLSKVVSAPEPSTPSTTREVQSSRLNIARLPAAAEKPQAVVVDSRGVHVPGASETIDFADVWKAAVDKIKTDLESETQKKDGERNQDKIAQLEKQLESEQAAYKALKDPKHPDHQVCLERAQEQLRDFKFQDTEVERETRQNGERGSARARIVVITALAGMMATGIRCARDKK